MKTVLTLLALMVLAVPAWAEQPANPEKNCLNAWHTKPLWIEIDKHWHMAMINGGKCWWDGSQVGCMTFMKNIAGHNKTEVQE